MKKVMLDLIKTIVYCIIGLGLLLSVMFLISSVARSDDYGPALDKAKTAFLDQSGLQKLQDDTTKYLNNRFIDPYWWTKDAGIILGGGYHTYKTRKIEIKLTGNWTLSLFQFGYGSGIRIPF